MKVCTLFVSVPQLKLWGFLSVGWDSNVSSCFPTPVNILIQVQCYLLLWQLHFNCGDSNNGVCHVTKTAIAESNPDMGCLTHSMPWNMALVLTVVLPPPAKQGPRSVNSTFVVLENPAKLKPVFKRTSFQWMERILSLPIVLFWHSDR